MVKATMSSTSFFPHLTRKSSHIPPEQGKSDTIGKYYGIYKDYLEMKAYVDDVSRNLNNKGEMDRFIAGTR